jgi:hypothetical protein
VLAGARDPRDEARILARDEEIAVGFVVVDLAREDQRLAALHQCRGHVRLRV